MKAAHWLWYRCAGRFRRQTCLDCYRDGRVSIWFYVPDAVWSAVMGDCQDVLCLNCFDVRARQIDVDYSGEIVLMGRGRGWRRVPLCDSSKLPKR